MPVMKGNIRIAVGYTLRVTGCSCACATVNQSLYIRESVYGKIRSRADGDSTVKGSCNNESGSGYTIFVFTRFMPSKYNLLHHHWQRFRSESIG